jgi:hypothetical protein
MKAPRINGKYIAIVHPSVVYDLRNSEYWIEAHKYAKPEEMYNGEIGELHGIRFIETPSAVVWKGSNLGESAESLTLTAYTEAAAAVFAPYGDATAYQATVSETITGDIVGRYAHFYDNSASKVVATIKIVGADPAAKKVWFDVPVAGAASGDKLQPGEGSADGGAVYGCLFLGKDAYGIIDPDGAAMEMIIHDKSEAGGPLNQFSTIGYKFSGGAKILYEDRMVRVECCSEFSDTDEDNSAPIKQANPVQMG